MTRALAIIALFLLGCPPEPTGPCSVEPLELDFGEVEPNREELKFVRLTNPSNEVRVWTVEEPAPPFSIPREVGLSVVLAPGTSRVIAISFRPQDGLLHLGAVTFRSPEGDCDFTVKLTGLGRGLLRSNPPLLEFTLAPGAQETKEVRIENSRRTSQRITVRSSFPSRVAVSEVPLEIPALGSRSLMVTAHASDWVPTDAALTLSSDRQQLIVPVRIKPSSPRMTIAPLRHDVPVVGLGQFVERTFRITNTGMSGDPAVPPLTVLSIPTLSVGDRVEISFSTRTLTPLAEADSVQLAVNVHPIGRPGPRVFQFALGAIESFIDPVELSMTVLAAEVPPCSLEITPLTSLQLHEVADGGIEGSVSFRNTTTNGCIVDNLRVRSDTHAIVSGGGTQITVPPGSTHQVTIAGPKAPTPSASVGQLSFHVMEFGKVDQSIDLRSP